jgi:hypothetical protein
MWGRGRRSLRHRETSAGCPEPETPAGLHSERALAGQTRSPATSNMQAMLTPRATELVRHGHVVTDPSGRGGAGPAAASSTGAPAPRSGRAASTSPTHVAPGITDLPMTMYE